MKIDNIADIDKLIDTPEGLSKTKLSMLADFEIYWRIMYLVCNAKQPIVMPFHYTIIEELEAIVFQENEKQNLCINLPPGAGKSVIIQYFISWGFARSRNNAFIYISSNQTLIGKLSRETKYIIENPYWQKIFNFRLKKDDRSNISWSFDGAMNRTGLIAKTLKSAIIGLDAGMSDSEVFSGASILDDLIDVGNVKYELAMNEVNEIFTDKLETRKRAVNTPTILIQQRLDRNDLPAYIKKHYPDDWKFVEIPALDENDNVVGLRYKDEFERQKLQKMLIDMRESNPKKFYAQYQQNPILAGGNIIKRDWFGYYNTLADKKLTKLFITGDTAQKTKENNDFSVFCLWALDKSNIYLVDLLRGKWEFTDLMDQAKIFWRKWESQVWNDSRRVSALYIEDKVSGTGLIQSLKRETRIPVHPIKRDKKDKILRLEEVLDIIASGKVLLPIQSNFNDLFLAECEAFTRNDTHKHDDIVDNLVDACQISKMPDLSWI
jgi:predicted phage terminase large subunit-like protein